MTYLILQTFVLLLLAALVGLVLGWYLTRLSAASAQGALQAKLDKAERAFEAVVSERDGALRARDHAESERRMRYDETIDLQARLDAALAASSAGDHQRVAELQAELVECRNALEAMTAPATANDEVVDTAAIADAAAAAASGAAGLLGVSTPPKSDEGEADDLQKIKGIGPKIATVLNDLGIRRFAQIAAWTPENVAWINDHLRFKGRVEREAWIEQASELMQGVREDA